MDSTSSLHGSSIHRPSTEVSANPVSTGERTRKSQPYWIHITGLKLSGSPKKGTEILTALKTFRPKFSEVKDLVSSWTTKSWAKIRVYFWKFRLNKISQGKVCLTVHKWLEEWKILRPSWMLRPSLITTELKAELHEYWLRLRTKAYTTLSKDLHCCEKILCFFISIFFRYVLLIPAVWLLCSISCSESLPVLHYCNLCNFIILFFYSVGSTACNHETFHVE